MQKGKNISVKYKILQEKDTFYTLFLYFTYYLSYFPDPLIFLDYKNNIPAVNCVITTQ